MRLKNCWPLTLAMAFLTGCTEEGHEFAAPEGPNVELGVNHDPSLAGNILGKVVWDGSIPDVPPFQSRTGHESQAGMPSPGPRANPHAPQVNPGNRGVAHAVLFLRQVDLRRSRPWDHEPVQVEHRDWKLEVRQGETVSSIGFVRRGESFMAVSKQKVIHMLRGEGAAFFALPFADAEVASAKVLDRKGRVELSSGADYHWMRAHLFVDDHPYYACSNDDGQFILTQVPPGVYQVVCWLPNWKVAWQDRNPESSHASRVGFRPPLEMPREVTVGPGQSVAVEFVISQKNFGQ